VLPELNKHDAESNVTGITQLRLQIGGDEARRRLETRHLDFSTFLLEGRRSIQLSYGRIVTNLHHNKTLTLLLNG
jgi:hypothetical protein